MAIFKVTQGQGEDVVLIHGGIDKHEFMQPIADFLSPHYKVTNIDTPGRGKSAWIPSIKNIDDFIDALLPALPEKAIYIGWSFGGLISIALASRYPERVERIILIGSSPKFIATEHWPAVPQGFTTAMPMIEAQGLNALLTAFLAAEFAGFEPKPNLDALLDKEDVDCSVIKQRLRIIDETDLRQEFKVLTCPIDLIWGSADDIISANMRDKILALNPRAKAHLISGAQHMMFWTHPQEFQAIVKMLLL